MRLFRRLTAAVLTGLALMSAVPQAGASPTPPQIPQQPQPRYYYVYYRADAQSPWYFYGWTTDPNTAAYHTNQLRSWGYDAYYR